MENFTTTKSCIHCKHLFSYIGFGPMLCEACKSVDEDNFCRVSDYIVAHARATALEVSDHTGVSVKTIDRYLKEGRLEIPDDSPIFIKCEICGQDIKCGKYCPGCAQTLGRSFKGIMCEVGEVPKKRPTGAMHFIGRA